MNNLKTKKYIFFILFYFFLILSCGNNKDKDHKSNTDFSTENALEKNVDQKRKIFILHSYECEHICGKPQGDGIKKVLIKKFGAEQLDFQSYYMDTKIKNVSDESKKIEAAKAISLIEEFNPEILFVLDDNAIKYVALELIGSPIKIVFSGMNGQPSDYNKIKPWLDNRGMPDKNMTGVYEYLHAVKSIEIMHKLFPNKKKLVALIDNTLTGDAVKKQLDLEFSEKKSLPFKVEFIRLSTMNELKKEILKINRDKEVFATYNALLSLKDENGNYVGVNSTFKSYIENCKIPSIAVNYSFAQLGLFGGVAVDFEKMGEQAGNIGIKILNGENIRNIPIEYAEKYMIIFNKARAKMLGIEIPKDIELVADELYQEITLLKD